MPPNQNDGSTVITAEVSYLMDTSWAPFFCKSSLADMTVKENERNADVLLWQESLTDILP